jgi:hypothetical protein
MRSGSARADDATAVDAAQVTAEVAGRIIRRRGTWRDGDPDILVIFDAGYDQTRLAWLLARSPRSRCSGGLRHRPGHVLPRPRRAAPGHQRPPALARTAPRFKAR